MTTKPSWGVLVEEAKKIWHMRYFNQSRTYRQLLAGELQFPISMSLKSPSSGNVIAENIEHFGVFVEQWRQVQARAQFEGREQLDKFCKVIWKEQNFQRVSTQQVPTQLLAYNVDALVYFIGGDVLQQWRKTKALLDGLEQRIECSDKGALRKVLIEHLMSLELMSSEQLSLLLSLIPQLRPKLGEGTYLRALPVVGVDTKFIEQYSLLIEDIVSVVYDSIVKDMGLLAWLGCIAKPKDWLLVRPLCGRSRGQLANLEILRLSTDSLINYPLAAQNILIIENEQSCLALNQMPNTIAVSGGGKNLSWLAADWLAHKRVAYWGDIDSEGFAMLSHARLKVPHVTALMMSVQEVVQFEERMVGEPDSVLKEPEHLSETERMLFRDLRADVYQGRRLEQERLDYDYIERIVKAWVVS